MKNLAAFSIIPALGLFFSVGCSDPDRTSVVVSYTEARTDPGPHARVPPVTFHSTAADTAGMGADLRVIERKLGRLDPGIRDELTVVQVRYFAFTDSTCTAVDTSQLRSGALVVHSCIAEEVRALFQELERDTFPIARVVPINRYGLNADSTGWDDAASMADNNTSAFNYRSKPTSGEASKHAQGIAIDINPRQNPMVRVNEAGAVMEPPDGRYLPGTPGTLDRAFTARYLAGRGWSWGGRWPRPQDHQHIEKSRGNCPHMRFSLK